MPGGLRAKIGADDREFTEVLERSSHKWKLFGRELNEGARGIGSLFGQTSKEALKLGEGFKLASAGAGIFAGADGLLGIAGSLAVGGPVLAGIGALSYAMNKVEKDAEESKKALDDFKGSMDVWARTTADAAGNTRSLQKRYDEIHESIDKLEKRFAGSLTGGFFGFDRWVVEHTTNLGALKNELALTGAKMFAVGEAFGKVAPKEAADRTRKLADEMERLRQIADKMNQKGMLEAWRLTQPNYAGGSVRGVAYQSMFAGMRLDSLNAMQPRGNMLNPLGLGDVKPEIFENVREFVDGQRAETDAITSGFAELPSALASVLAPLLAGMFGNNRGAQVGGSLLSAVGGGVGNFYGKRAGEGIGGALGSAAFPVIGTLVGGLLGGVIGSLFGGQKKSVDYNTSALNANTAALEKLTNVPSGYKVDRAAFRAQDPATSNSSPYSWGASATAGGASVALNVDGRTFARIVLNVLRRESQAQFGTTTRIAEVAI